MNIKPINNFNFGKTYLQTFDVKTRSGAKQSVDLVEYDPFDKGDRLQIGAYEKSWGSNAKHIEKFIKSFLNEEEPCGAGFDGGLIGEDEDIVEHRYLGLEDNQGDALVLAKTSDDYSDELEIELIQSNPKEMYGAKGRQYKGLGAMLVGKIVEIAQQIGKGCVVTLSENDKFWNNSRLFKKEEGSEGLMILNEEDFDSYIRYADKKANS